jgi:hypothetical protein
VLPHRHLPVHQHRQQPVAELGEFLGSICHDVYGRFLF